MVYDCCDKETLICSWLLGIEMRAYIHTTVFAHRIEAGGELHATNGSQDLFHIKSLETALGVYPSALIRSNDMVCMSIDLTRSDVAKLLKHADFPKEAKHA